MRRALRAGSAYAAARAKVRAELGFLAASIHSQIASIRARRAMSASEVTLRRAWRRWRAILAELP